MFVFETSLIVVWRVDMRQEEDVGGPVRRLLTSAGERSSWLDYMVGVEMETCGWSELFIYLFFVFLGPHPWHMQVPRLGLELELQLLAYVTVTAMEDQSCVFDLHHSSQQCWILNPLSEAWEQTHVLMDTSLVGYC